MIRVPEQTDAELLPVRTVADTAFCPRSVWLKRVAGVFEDNQHTVTGSAAHRRVDKPGGKLAAPETGPDWESRSLWLSCAILGINGKLDLTESDERGVIAVDTKNGRSRDGHLWPFHRVQLTLQSLLLRSAGYECNHAAAWYIQERRRVWVDIDDDDVNEALSWIAVCRTTLAATTPPAPLVDSRKCNGCSLIHACQPDEIHHLAEHGAALAKVAVRRVVPPRDTAIPLIVQEQAARIRLRKGELAVHTRDGPTRTVGLEQLSQVAIYGNAQITSQSVHACMDRGLPIHFFSSGGWYRGMMHSAVDRRIHTRIAQFEHASGARGFDIARQLIADKIANGRTLLRRNLRDALTLDTRNALDSALRNAAKAADRETLLGIEGAAARAYWASFSSYLTQTDPAFAMAGRTRRPPRDATNAMLGYVYGMLVKDCQWAVMAAGLDTFLGVFHTAHHGQPGLALDLMEVFRPLIAESVVLRAVTSGEVAPSGFIYAGQAVRMKPAARKAILRGYERRVDTLITHPIFGYRISYRQVLAVQARLLARALTGEIDAMTSFRTR